MHEEKPHPWTITADPRTCAALAAFIKNAGLAMQIKLEPGQENPQSITAKIGAKSLTFNQPLKIGALLDALISAAQKADSDDHGKDIGHPLFSLNRLRGTIRLTGSDTEIRLTEKETGILSYLLENTGRTVTRKELLTAVWEYAENVETHTLETHIYRLRQKIEGNPSEPIILITSENGYTLNP